MADIHDIRWQRLTGKLGSIAYEVTQVKFSQGAISPQWRPAINAYRCREGMVVCVDLAGVAKEQIDLQVEPRRLLLRGHRVAPEPDRASDEPLQILAMEIDCGGFARELALPAEVDSRRVRAEHREGLLWIYLPFQPQA